MKHTPHAISLVLLACIIAGNAAADRYVAQAGQAQDPAHEYTDWSIAASNIQTAVNAADPGETVWVSNGVYRTTSSPVVSITKSLSLRSVVANSEAVIDGEGARRGISIAPTTPAYVLVEGFTVSNCYQLNANGGGILIDNTLPGTAVVHNCVLVTNRVQLTAAPSGGGLAATMQPGTNFYTIVSDCTITRNYSGTSGGGIYSEYGQLLVDNCYIANNHVDVWDPFAIPPVAAVNGRNGGGISVVHPERAYIIRNCVIENNRASRWGGGIQARYDGVLLVENCEIRGNVAPNGAGILIAGHSGNPTNIVRGCLIDHNWALTNNITTTYGYGGGLQIGDVTLGAGNNVHVENCTVVSNIARIDGGGVRIYTAGGMTAWNSIFYNNWTTGDNDSNYYGTATWTNCLVGTVNVLPGSGNITDQNPGFLDFDGQNYHLTRTSPCVDNGYNLSWTDATAKDLDGNLRVRPAGGDVDIGAYEYQPTGTLITIL